MKIIKKLIIFSLLIIVLITLIESNTVENLRKNKAIHPDYNIRDNVSPLFRPEMGCPAGYELNSNFVYLNCYGDGDNSIPFWRGSAKNSYCCVKKDAGIIKKCSDLGLKKSKISWKDCPRIGGMEPDQQGHFKFEKGYVIYGKHCCVHPDLASGDENCPKNSPINNWNYGISRSWNHIGQFITNNNQSFTNLQAYLAWFRLQSFRTAPYWDYYHYTNCYPNGQSSNGINNGKPQQSSSDNGRRPTKGVKRRQKRMDKKNKKPNGGF